MVSRFEMASPFALIGSEMAVVVALFLVGFGAACPPLDFLDFVTGCLGVCPPIREALEGGKKTSRGAVAFSISVVIGYAWVCGAAQSGLFV